MNAMLAAGEVFGYPWTIISVERRNDDMSALEAASVDRDIRPFTVFLNGLVSEVAKDSCNAKS